LAGFFLVMIADEYPTSASNWREDLAPVRRAHQTHQRGQFCWALANALLIDATRKASGGKRLRLPPTRIDDQPMASTPTRFSARPTVRSVPSLTSNVAGRVYTRRRPWQPKTSFF
jgi:hypothetical protein